MNFLENLKRETNKTKTTNEAGAYHSTLNYCLDLFSTIGAMRNTPLSNKVQSFLLAYHEDAEMTLKMLFYARDIREGLGERQTFRELLTCLAHSSPETLKPLVKLIPFYGRWDDLYALVNTPLEQEVINVFRQELFDNGDATLLWKWFKSVNTSSKESCRLGKWTAEKVFNDTNARNYFPAYRKELKLGRQRVTVLEQLMSENKWTDVDYNLLTSYNNIKYIKAFLKHDAERYTKFVLDGDMNGKVLFPYDIVGKILNGELDRAKSKLSNNHEVKKIQEKVYDNLWKALPKLEVDESSLVVVDTSGSMAGTPMEMAISLGIYFSEQAKGVFKDTFITFSKEPTLQQVTGNTIAEKVWNVHSSRWQMNTDIEKVFDVVLKSALSANSDAKDIPNQLIIISDMQFDQATAQQSNYGFMQAHKPTTQNSYSFIDSMKEKYSEAGYEFPQLVFWNVNARESNQPITIDDNGFIMVSGASQNAIKTIMLGKVTVQEFVEEEEVIDGEVVTKIVEKTRTTQDPCLAMKETLYSDRYKMIVVEK